MPCLRCYFNTRYYLSDNEDVDIIGCTHTHTHVLVCIRVSVSCRYPCIRVSVYPCVLYGYFLHDSVRARLCVRNSARACVRAPVLYLR